MKRTLLIFSLLLTLTSCRPPRGGFCMEGADQFVLDSYCIRQGKNAILEMEGHCVGELPDDAMDPYEDRIAENDILNIALYHPTRRDLMESMQFINNQVGFRVKEGQIDLPDIPPVYVEGMTLKEAKHALERHFRGEIQDVEIFVTYRERLSKKVELAGLVHTPSIPVDGNIRLFEVLSKAAVPTNANFFMSYVERRGEVLPIDMHRLMVKGDMTQNIVMHGGDKIFIADPSEARAMVMGEVLHPTPITMPSGSISLREALVLAGGIPFTGDKRCIHVIRGGVPNPKIYLLSWQHILHLPNESLLLIPGDTVYVSEAPLTKWNRFISQLLPSMQGVTSGGEAYQVFVP